MCVYFYLFILVLGLWVVFWCLILFLFKLSCQKIQGQRAIQHEMTGGVFFSHVYAVRVFHVYNARRRGIFCTADAAAFLK